MLLLELLTNYIFRTIPVVSINAFLIPLQIIFQLFSPVFIMINVIRRRTITERIVLIAMPVACCLTVIIMIILLGGSFLHGGYSHETEFVDYILHSGVINEIWVVLFLFIISYLILEFILHFRIDKPSRKLMLLNLPGTLINLCLFFLCFITTIYIQKTGNFPSIGQISENSLIKSNSYINNWLVYYFTYAVYNLVFQIFVNILALFMHILFSGKEMSGDIRLLSTSPDWCEREIKHFFTDGYKIMFYSFVQFVILFYGLMFWAISDEGFSLSLVFWFHVFLIPLDLLTVYSLFYILFPSLLPVFKKMEVWENPQQIKRQFCLEFLDSAYLREQRMSQRIQQGTKQGIMVWTTPHFILTPVSFFKKLYYIPVYEKIQGQKIMFKDGSYIKMQNLHSTDYYLIQSAIHDFHHLNN